MNAAVFMKNGDGLPESVRVSLPFAFPIRCDRAKPGMRAVVTATVCGVSVRQKKEGELEAEGALKLFVVLFEGTSSAYVSRLEAGEAEEEKRSAIGVHIPAAGDTLWITAKKLGKTPEEVQSSIPNSRSRCRAASASSSIGGKISPCERPATVNRILQEGGVP